MVWRTLRQTLRLAALLIVCGFAFGGETKVSSLVVEPSVLDVGEVPMGESADGVSTVRNTGAEPIEIVAVRSSCGCAGATMSDRQLAPGEMTELSVRVKGGVDPTIEQRVTLVASDGSVVVVPVRGRVRTAVSAQVDDYERLASGELRVELSMESSDDRAFQPLPLQQPLRWESIDIDGASGVGADPGSNTALRWRGTVLIQADPEGRFPRNFIVPIDHPVQRAAVVELAKTDDRSSTDDDITTDSPTALPEDAFVRRFLEVEPDLLRIKNGTSLESGVVFAEAEFLLTGWTDADGTPAASFRGRSDAVISIIEANAEARGLRVRVRISRAPGASIFVRDWLDFVGRTARGSARIAAVLEEVK